MKATARLVVVVTVVDRSTTNEGDRVSCCCDGEVSKWLGTRRGTW